MTCDDISELTASELNELRRSARRSVSAPSGFSMGKAMLTSMNTSDNVVINVMSTVDQLRKQRKGMVLNPEQYKFCYTGVLKHLQEVLKSLNNPIA